MNTDEPPLIGLHDLAKAVGTDNAHRLMTGLMNAEEARKVLEEQKFLQAGRLDRAVDHFYQEECGGHIEGYIPPGAYVYWWMRSKQMGGEPGDFWRSDEERKWFFKKNPGCATRNRMRNVTKGWTGALVTGSKYGDARKEAGVA